FSPPSCLHFPHLHSFPTRRSSDLSLVNTIFLLFGNALPIDSKFFLPKIIECPVVIFLTYCQSFGILHGISLFLPITRFLSIATINETFIIYTTFSYYFTILFSQYLLSYECSFLL